MNTLTRRWALLALLLSGTVAMAQNKYPEGPIKMIVPFAAGGGVDSAARLIAKQLGTQFNTSVVVENKPGASGSVGGKAVRTATPDGQTLLFSASTQALIRQVMATPPALTDVGDMCRSRSMPSLLCKAWPSQARSNPSW